MKTIPCWLYEPDGSLLPGGTACLSAATAGKEVVVAELDRPGSVLARCVLGEACDVHVELERVGSVPARLERMFFDPHMGHTCTFRIMADRR